MMIALIIFIFLYIIMILSNPWIDKYKDYYGNKHIVLWYTDIFGERRFINLIGSQK